jgi:hypothetical protein
MSSRAFSLVSVQNSHLTVAQSYKPALYCFPSLCGDPRIIEDTYFLEFCQPAVGYVEAYTKGFVLKNAIAHM